MTFQQTANVFNCRRNADSSNDSAWRPALVIAGWLVLCFSTQVTLADSKQRQIELDNKIMPLLKRHCLDCHSGAEPDAGLTLDHFETPLSFLKGRFIWEKAVQKMRIMEMPPPDVSELSDAEREELMGWILQTIEEYECGLEPNPGRVTLRRLNATEYSNTIRDLFGLKSFKPASNFPGDDVGYGFDNIGDVLTLPPLLMEKYFLEAERISKALIQTPPPTEMFEQGYPGGQLQVDASSSRSERELTLASQGTAKIREQVPWAGIYEIAVTAGGDQAGDEPCLMGIEIDGKLVRRIPVPNDRGEPQTYTLRTRLRAGSREIGISFLNDFYRAGNGGQEKLDRNLVVHHLAIAGKKPGGAKLDPSQLSEYHRRILFTTPKNTADRERATRAVVTKWINRAYRRVVEPAEVDRLVDFAMELQDDGDSFEESIQVVLQVILVSPNFLFRVEPPSEALGFTKFRDLDEFELATRLSYFLWSSMPDDELFSLAWKKQLRQGDTLRQQVARMVKDPRAQDFIKNFAGQWLTLRKLRDFQPDRSQFPQWNERIKRLAEYETLRFFSEVMRRDMSVLRLLDADFTYLNQELAEFYGIPNVQGASFRPVSLKGTPRAGLLTQASVLAVTSNPTRTSPVKRGKWILENLLATPPPPAPPGVPELQEKKGELTGTLRERLEQHRADPACANCHKLMDPLGFALENFDAIGQYRTRDGTLAIDASGELPGGIRVRGAAELQQLLIRRHKEQFVECLTEKMLTYALGRGLEYYDKCALDKIIQALEDDDYRFSTLLVGIVTSDPFQKKGEREWEQ